MSSVNLEYIDKMRLAHGVLAASSWVIFFPIGAMAIRLLPAPYAFRVHAVAQILTYLLFTAAVGIAIHLSLYFESIGDFPNFRYAHAAIGLTVFILAFLQVVLGLAHHVNFKKLQRRTFASYGHIWVGRAVITLAIINGGLGLELTAEYQNVKPGYIVYGVIGGVMWCLTMATSVFGEVKRSRANGEGADVIKRDSSSSTDEEGGVGPEKAVRSAA